MWGVWSTARHQGQSSDTTQSQWTSDPTESKCKASQFITFVQVYAPIGASFEEEITAFYEQLQGVWDNVYRQDVIVITGDWNANIGNPRINSLTT